MAHGPSSMLAGGNINPRRFVKLSDEFTVQQSGSGEAIYGVSHVGQKLAPISGNSTVAAASGDAVGVYTDGQQCLLDAGGSFSAGAKLRSDADGKAVEAGATDDYGAIALEDATSGAQVMVRVHIGETA